MSVVTSAPPLSRVEAARRVLRGLLAGEQSDRSWVEAIPTLGADWLQQQGLAPLTWFSVRKSTALPPDLLAMLHRFYLAAVADAELHHQELLTVLQTLAARDIRPVVFKGAALAYTVYPDPACRPMSDLDLWIPPSDMPGARAALGQIGYRVAPRPDRPPALMERFKGEISLSHPHPAHGLVELHWSVFVGEWLRLTADIDDTMIQSRAARAVLLDQPVLFLAPEDAILQLIAHVAVNHQFSLNVSRSMIDLTLLAHASAVDWDTIAKRARAWRLATTVWLTLTLAIDLIGLDEARAIVSRLAPSRPRQWLLARLVNGVQIAAQGDLRTSRRRFVLLLLLVERRRDLLRLIFRTLWPERDWLQARYGRSGVSVHAKHLLNALRGHI